LSEAAPATRGGTVACVESLAAEAGAALLRAGALEGGTDPRGDRGLAVV
jgi:hypothetical protein